MPYPLTDGGAIGIFKATEATSKAGADITFVAYPEKDADVTREGVQRLSEFATVHLCSKLLPSRPVTLARTIFKGAYPVERRMMKPMFELLASIVEQNSFDLMHVDHSHMGKYALWMKEMYGLPYVLRQHNFESQIYERFARTQKNPVVRRLSEVHGKRLRQEEIVFIREAMHVVAITEEDKELMREAVPQQNFTVIPAGVDTEYFIPSQSPVDPMAILWIGGMGWDPNREALDYFLREIWPLALKQYPPLHLDLVGEGTDRYEVPADLRSSVKAYGRVPDIRPYLANAGVMVVPLRAGGGMRLKILDFFAAGKAVVSTSLGAEGNLARDGEHLLLADTPEDFMREIVTLIEDPALRSKLGNSARKLVEDHYSWRIIGEKFFQLYQGLTTPETAPIPQLREL